MTKQQVVHQFAEPFAFKDLDGRMIERPLREMISVEVLRAWHFHSRKADEICERTHLPEIASDEEFATVAKAQRLWDLIEAALGDAWQDGMSVGNAVTQFWPFKRPPDA